MHGTRERAVQVPHPCAHLCGLPVHPGIRIGGGERAKSGVRGRRAREGCRSERGIRGVEAAGAGDEVGKGQGSAVGSGEWGRPSRGLGGADVGRGGHGKEESSEEVRGGGAGMWGW